MRGGDYIGWFQATGHDDGRADLAYLVFAAHQRRGYAVEACRAIIGYLKSKHGVRTIRTTIDKKNTASIELARKLDLKCVSEDGRVLRFEEIVPR